MNRSAPLSPEARRLLELGSHVEPPTPEQNERMDRAVAALFRTGRVGSGSGPGLEHSAPERSAIHRRPSPRPVSRRLDSLLHLGGSKAWLALGALAATASASFWLGRVSSPADEAQRLQASVTTSASAPTSSTPPLASAPLPPGNSAFALASDDASLVPAPVLVGSGAALPRVETASVAGGSPPLVADASPASASLGSGKPRARGPSSARESLGLGAEIEQLARVEAALRKGRAQQALTLLEQQTVSHLLEQSEALRAIAGCELDTPFAARDARGALERWPASAFRLRIANACGL